MNLLSDTRKVLRCVRGIAIRELALRDRVIAMALVVRLHACLLGVQLLRLSEEVDTSSDLDETKVLTVHLDTFHELMM